MIVLAPKPRENNSHAKQTQNSLEIFFFDATFRSCSPGHHIERLYHRSASYESVSALDSASSDLHDDAFARDLLATVVDFLTVTNIHFWPGVSNDETLANGNDFSQACSVDVSVVGSRKHPCDNYVVLGVVVC